MSLTFEFPQWQLSVVGNRSQRSGTLGEGIAGQQSVEPANDAVEWAADLDDLSSDEGGPETAAGSPVDPAAVTAAAAASGGDVLYQAFGVGARASAFDTSEEVVGTVGPGPTSCSRKTEGGYAVALLSTGTGSGGSTVPTASGYRPADGPRVAPPAAISGEAIPSEVLLLVLSELRDVGDCVRAACVCRHWHAVVTLSNELWFELHALHLSGGWPRPPHAGRPLLRPPPGCGHPGSRMLAYKATCALTQVAVRYMALRKGFEYVTEAAGSLWLAVENAAATANGTGGQQQQQQQLQEPESGQPRSDSRGAGADASDAATGSNGANGEHGASPPTASAPSSSAQACSGSTAAVPSSNAIGSPGGSTSYSDSHNNAGGATGARRRITHVEQLWESCGRSRTALQVDDRFNAVRVQQMVSKLVTHGSAAAGSGWAAAYEGIAAIMTGRADEIRWRLGEELQRMQAAAARQREDREEDRRRRVGATSGVRQELACASPAGSEVGRTGNGGDGIVQFRGVSAAYGCPPPRSAGGMGGDVVYGGSSYADRFAELLRRGDTRGALALADAGGSNGVAGCNDSGGGRRAGGQRFSGDSGGVGGGLFGELDEPEMRQVMEMPWPNIGEGAEGQAAAAGSSDIAAGAEAGGAGSTHESMQADRLRAVVSHGLALWRQLLRQWALYRRWLEVLAVWAGPLGARVEAERQLAGAAAGPGETPLAPSHLANRGLLAFRGQVLLAYPLRRPLQAAALWLATRAREDRDARDAAWGLAVTAVGVAPAGGCGDARPGLTDEEAGLLIGIRKALTELAVPDDATQPNLHHTRDKLHRCFGELLRRRPAAAGCGLGRGPAAGATGRHDRQRYRGSGGPG